MLCTALVSQPEVLFLDEPTSGLDVPSTRMIREILHELNQQGLTVFLTTHNMGEAEEMCSGVAIMNSGRIVAIGTFERLRSAIRSSQYVDLRFCGRGLSLPQLEALPGVLRVSYQGDRIRLYSETPGRLAMELARLAQATDAEIKHLSTCKPSLEDVFLYFTGGRAEERHP